LPVWARAVAVEVATEAGVAPVAIMRDAMAILAQAIRVGTRGGSMTLPL
jgi:hypothetical protein